MLWEHQVGGSSPPAPTTCLTRDEGFERASAVICESAPREDPGLMPSLSLFRNVDSIPLSSSTTYDEVPYRSRAVTAAHPSRIAALAALHDVEPPDPRTCRYLDVGCAEGGNPISIAVSLPGTEVVGIDLSETQVAEGRRRVARLSLTNCDIRQQNLEDVSSSLGLFDYVVCNGVYSWVTPRIADRILALCKALLSPTGLLYVSYNTYPGWHYRQIAREIAMLASAEGSPAERIRKGKAAVAAVATSNLVTDAAYRTDLAWLNELVDAAPEAYFFHEFLEVENHPCWFREFATSASAHGLSYVEDARFGSMPLSSLYIDPTDATRKVSPDRIVREQYSDFLTNRPFRQSILCHAGRPVTDEAGPAAIGRLALSTQLRPESTFADSTPGKKENFVRPGGIRLSTDDPLLKTALLSLAVTGQVPMRFEDLVASLPAGVLPDGGTEREMEVERLKSRLLRCAGARFVDLYLGPPAVSRSAGPLPVASPLARLQATEGDRSFTSLVHHDDLLSDGLAQALLPLLDGTRDRAVLTDEVVAEVLSEGLLEDSSGKPVSDPHVVREVVRGRLEQILAELASRAFILR